MYNSTVYFLGSNLERLFDELCSYSCRCKRLLSSSFVQRVLPFNILPPQNVLFEQNRYLAHLECCVLSGWYGKHYNIN